MEHCADFADNAPHVRFASKSVLLTTLLHVERLDAVTDALLASGARRVVDLGCGGGQLLQRLRGYAQFERLLGIDIDAKLLTRARERLGVDLFRPDARLEVRRGSFEDHHWAERGIQAAVMLETIEHVPPSRLSRVENAIFGGLRPGFIVITTPNREFNPLHGLAPGERRHPGHYFEWTRAQFGNWCEGVAARHGYQVSMKGIGPPAPGCGSSSQMATFRISEVQSARQQMVLVN